MTQRAAALGAGGGHGEDGFGAVALVGDDALDGGDDVARLDDPNAVAGADVFTGDLVGVVKRGAGDLRTCEQHGFEFCNGGEHAGATDLYGDFPNAGFSALGLVFESAGPARRFGGGAKGGIKVASVDLDDRAVDFEGEAVSQVLELVDGGEHGADIHAEALPRRSFEPPVGELLEHAAVGGEGCAFDGTCGIDDGVQRAAGNFARVELFERTCGGVARIHERLASGLFFTPVEFGEAGAGHVDLTAHFEQVKGVGEREGNGADGLDVGGDVIAYLAVAARGGACQESLLVEQGEGDAIDFGFDHIVPGLVGQLAVKERVEVDEIVAGVGLVEAHHGRAVANLLEGGEGRAADALRGRVGGEPLGVRSLEGFELSIERVIVGVADLGARVDIVEAVMAADFGAELFDAGKRHGERLVIGSRFGVLGMNKQLELGHDFVDGADACGDGFRTAVELKRHDVADFGLDQNVRRVEGEFAAGDLILDQAERAGEHIKHGEGVCLIFLRGYPAVGGLRHR